jgi:hypothetical protein
MMFVVFVSDCVYVHNGVRFCEEVVKEEYESRSSVNYEIKIECKSSALIGLLLMEIVLTILSAFLHVTWTAAFCDGRSAGAMAKAKGNMSMSASSAVALPFAAVGTEHGGGGGGGISKILSNTHKRTTSDPLQNHTLLAKRVSAVV